MKKTLLILALLGTSFASPPKLILWSFPVTKKDFEIPVKLQTDYGFMVINTGSIEKPVAHYVFGDAKAGVVQHFSDKKLFLKSLQKMKKGGVLAHYSKCLTPSDLGLNDEDSPHEEIQVICKKLGVSFHGVTHSVCRCPDVKYSERDNSPSKK